MDMVMAQLVAETGVAARTIRHWIALELLPKPAGVGPAALYSREHLQRIWAVLGLRREGLQLGAMKDVLDGMTPRQMARFRPQEPPGATTPREDGEGGPAAPGDALAATFDERLPGRLYAMVSLLPGLVLMVDEGASGLVRRTALEIVERYAATRG
jgi:DNA-binding transcriptional MerR regulator